MKKLTGKKDVFGRDVRVGDLLQCRWGYQVIVSKRKDGSLYGKLVCDKNHSCKNIPYSIDSCEENYCIIEK